MPRRIRQKRSWPTAIMRPDTREEELTIAINTDVSTVIDTDNGRWRLVGVKMPAAWTAASITFDVSADGVSWHNLRHAGAEYTIVAAGGADADLAFTVLPAAVDAWPFIRIRSGVTGTYVDQLAERELVATLTTNTY